MHERKIKELAIALEALSRINAEVSLYSRVRDLLGETLEKLEDERLNPISPPWDRPTTDPTDDFSF